MWRSGMFWQFFSTSGGVLLLAILVLGIVVIRRAEEIEYQQIRQNLFMKARLVQETIRGFNKNQISQLNDRLHILKDEINVHISLIAEDGMVLADSMNSKNNKRNQNSKLEIRQARKAGMATVRRSGPDGEEMIYFGLRNEDSTSPVGFIRIALPESYIDNKMVSLKIQVWTTVGILGGIGLALAFLFTRRIIRPLHELARGVEQIAAGDYGRKVFAEGHHEIGILARTFNDTSERLAAQFTQIDSDRQTLRAILSSMVEGVIAIDAEQHILFANERAADLLEFKTHTAVGRRLWEVVRHRPIHEMVNSAIHRAEIQNHEFNWNGPNSKSLTIHAGPLPGSPPRGAVLVLHDTTELRRLESIRQEFVANVSHELKTPLSVITTHVETLEDGAIDDLEHRGRFLEQISSHANRLHNLILDLLSLARIEAGTETYSFQNVSLEKIIESCLKRCQPLLEEKNQTLEVVPPDSPIHAWADEEAVGQILDNLVDNAIKYTPNQGHVTVKWWAEGESVLIQVRDTGLGIPKEQLHRIFERFYRVDKARSREMGGTGLGLAIVKHLVQAMRGNIHAESELGKGSSFTVRLPIRSA